jgi:hypothetical protein
MSDINITSQNQSGGFTGINKGTVNLAPPKRVITPEQKAAFEKFLVPADKNEPIEIRYSTQDGEQRQYGESLTAVLQKAGFNVIVDAGMIFDSPPVKESIRIFSPKDPTAANEAVLLKALTEAHVRGEWRKLDRVIGPAPIQITIGPNPEN